MKRKAGENEEGQLWNWGSWDRTCSVAREWTQFLVGRHHLGMWNIFELLADWIFIVPLKSNENISAVWWNSIGSLIRSPCPQSRSGLHYSAGIDKEGPLLDPWTSSMSSSYGLEIGARPNHEPRELTNDSLQGLELSVIWLTNLPRRCYQMSTF
jgi:hypothetical protein